VTDTSQGLHMSELQNDSDRVGLHRECRLLVDADGDDYQLKRIERC